MNYELAKELKEAGFPVTIDWETYKNTYIPTLSELIAACGRPMQLNVNKTGYGANFNGGDFWAEGKSAEEAVARLWLSLNKK